MQQNANFDSFCEKTQWVCLYLDAWKFIVSYIWSTKFFSDTKIHIFIFVYKHEEYVDIGMYKITAEMILFKCGNNYFFKVCRATILFQIFYSNNKSRTNNLIYGYQFYKDAFSTSSYSSTQFKWYKCLFTWLNAIFK